MIDNYKSLSEKFLKKGIWLYVFSFIIGPLGYVTSILLSRNLEVGEVGIIYSMISLITLVGAFNDFGISESIKYFLPKYVEEKNYDKIKSIIVYGLLAQMGTGLLLTFTFFFGAPFIAEYYFKTKEALGVVQNFAFYFLGLNIFQLISSFFLAVQNTFLTKILEFIRNLTIAGFTVFFILGGIQDIATFSFAWIFGLYVSICFGVLFFYKKYFSKYLKNTKVIWEKQHIISIFKYALLILLGTQSSTILGQMDMFMITLIQGTVDVGYYTNYLKIINIPFLVITPIFVLLFPIISELSAKNDVDSIRMVKTTFTKIFFSLAIFISAFFLTFGEQIATILYGDRYITSGIILQFSALFLIFNFLLQINFNIIAGIGKAKQRFYIILIAIFVNFFANLVLITTVGVYGAALATGLGWIVIYYLGEYFLGKEYKITHDFHILGKNIIAFAFLVASFYFGKNVVFGEIGELQVFLRTFIIGLFWLGVYMLLNKKMIRDFVGEVKKLRN